MKHVKHVLVAVSALVLVGGAPVAYATNYDTQINALQSQIKDNQQAANQKRAEADTLQGKVNQLNAEVAAAQAALSLTQTELKKTQEDINTQTVELGKQTDNLRENLRAMYRDRDLTPIEVLASSQNLSDFVGRQQYMQDIKSKVEANIATINATKAKLEQDKADLTAQQVNEQGQIAQISAKKAEQAQLLAETKGQEAAYQSRIAKNKQQLDAVFAARAAEIARNNQAGGSFRPGGQCGGGYPNIWCQAAQDSMVDDYGYYNRECVSYAAWKRASLGRWVPRYWGNAGDWYYRASGGTPSYGDVVVWPYSSSSPWGHVAIVESNNGSSITISEYNYSPRGGYSQRTIPFSQLGGVRYLH